ncbi:MAG: hypothetical protein ACFFA4_04170 [Promethearchaeota archaeon]
MSGKEEHNFTNYISDAQEKVKEFVQERELLNSKIKNYIISFQSFDSEIAKSLYEAREFYYKKRYYYNIKLEKLKRKKIGNEQHWNYLIRKLNTLTKPELNGIISTSIEYTTRTLEDIENKLELLNQKLEDQILNIEEENEIIEKIRDLERNQEKKIQILVGLKQKQIAKLQNSEYFKIQSEIKNLEIKLTEIYENIFKISNKRLITHKKMLDLYRKAREFEKIKKRVENELIESKNTAEGYHQLFVKLIDLNKKVLLDELSNKPIIELRPKEIKKLDEKAIIKKKKKHKKLEQKKLAIALDKQKSGKKLNFYEYQLILKHSKK